MMASCFRLCYSCRNRLQGVRAFTRKSLLSRACHSSQPWNSTKGSPKVNLWEEYQKVKDSVEAAVSHNPIPDIQADAVFANNETKLADIDVYGFDYDYTLATYKRELHDLIYELGREALVQLHKYPDNIKLLKYNPDFAVRGLHYDVQKGLLMKIDAFHNIQPGTVYRGLTSLSMDEVISLYEGTHVPVENMNSFHGTGKHMHQLMDLFAIPEMTLLANVIEYFIQNNIPYDSEYVFHDVRNAVQGLHTSGTLHQQVMGDLDYYLGFGSGVSDLIKRLSAAKRKLFLITNSPFSFVDRGMSFIMGSEWTEYFDVIITSARKPKFFNESQRPFRVYDRNLGTRTFGRVMSFEKGFIYTEGNLAHFRELTNWFGSKVLYFGDHVYSDLARGCPDDESDPNLKHGWHTGAIIPELEDEIQVINSANFKQTIRWLLALQDLIEKMQVHEDAESQATIAEWLRERDELRVTSKNVFNPYFGSLFRTYHNPTYFSRRLSRFADLYMASIENLMNYSLNHTFYPRRAALPHEVGNYHY
ncbi:5'-nucleotidase domain-containing protein 3-like isoform X2 [Lineus longissimus]|uniref:5'-nucleotidase domain-containing protein 3-like isoform X2 n=1 Tax=Lineus longissimus TaxID=88925 RepID=UPI002B4E62F6